MKTFALAVFVTFGFALGPNLVNAKVHECFVNLSRYTTAEEVRNEEPSVPPENVGTFEINSPSEGRTEDLTFPIKGTRMNIFVHILYDDNMAYYDDFFNDAINLSLIVSETKKPDLAKSLAVATTQMEYTNTFRTAYLGVMVNRGNRWYDIWLSCRVKDDKKKKALDEIMELERKEALEEKKAADDAKKRHPKKP
ncbi:MAG: hypothetical protein WBC19_10675 [Pyrinomonadaceae bacterium]